MAKQKW